MLNILQRIFLRKCLDVVRVNTHRRQWYLIATSMCTLMIGRTSFLLGLKVTGIFQVTVSQSFNLLLLYHSIQSSPLVPFSNIFQININFRGSQKVLYIHSTQTRTTQKISATLNFLIIGALLNEKFYTFPFIPVCHMHKKYFQGLY